MQAWNYYSFRETGKPTSLTYLPCVRKSLLPLLDELTVINYIVKYILYEFNFTSHTQASLLPDLLNQRAWQTDDSTVRRLSSFHIYQKNIFMIPKALGKIFCELTRQKSNFSEDLCPTSYQQSNVVVLW